MKRLKLLLFYKNNKVQTEQDPQQVQMYKSILTQSAKALDIFEIQRELLKVRIMLRMLFSAEQYAAIQLCGSRFIADNQFKTIDDINSGEDKLIDKQNQNSETPPLSVQKPSHTKGKSSLQNQLHQDNLAVVFDQYQNSQNIITNCNLEESQKNHLETIDLIEKDDNQLQKHLDKFLSNNKQIPTSEINRRIMFSMINCKNPSIQTSELQINNFDIETQKQVSQVQNLN